MVSAWAGRSLGEWSYSRKVTRTPFRLRGMVKKVMKETFGRMPIRTPRATEA